MKPKYIGKLVYNWPYADPKYVDVSYNPKCNQKQVKEPKCITPVTTAEFCSSTLIEFNVN